MKRNLLLLSLLLLTISTNIQAVPAYPYPIKMQQMDGTELTIQLVGDEFFHYTQTLDGLVVQKNKNDIYEYVEFNSDGLLVLSGVKANDSAKRNLKENEFIKTLREKRVKENWLNVQEKKDTNIG